MEVIQFLEENMLLTLSVGIGMVVLFLSVYKIDGFAVLLAKAVGVVLQQLCSLIVEAVCLVFKIINALEVYIVLLIDALTGKASADGKIASLAIGVLSIASFYTTYTGMKYFVEEDEIAFLITLGIQAILFSTSLQIGEALDFNKNGKNSIWTKRISVSAIVAASGCISAYLFGMADLRYSIKTEIYHVLYMIVIVAAVCMILLLIMGLIKTSVTNQNKGVILFIIYFAVLSISSFFSSYNKFRKNCQINFIFLN